MTTPDQTADRARDVTNELVINLARAARALLDRPPELRGPFKTDEEALERVAGLGPRTKKAKESVREVARLAEETNQCRQRAEAVLDERARLAKEIETLHTKIDRKTDELVDLLTERDGLLAQIEALRRRATLVEKSAGFATDDVARLDDENKRLRSALTVAQAENARLREGALILLSEIDSASDMDCVIAASSALRTALSADKPAAQAENARKDADLREVLKSVLYHFGPEGANKVTTDAMAARLAALSTAQEEK